MKKFREMIDLYADLAEIGQKGSLRFCFATIEEDGTIRGQHVFVKCRDFLTDAQVGSHGRYVTPRIYGFKYDGKDDPIDTDKTRFVLRLSTPAEQIALMQNKEKLNNMLINAGFARTTIEEVEPIGDTSGGGKYYLVEGDPRWVSHTLGVSFYTLMLRVISNQVIKPEESLVKFMKTQNYHSYNDWSYLSSFWRVFDHPNDFIKKLELFDMRAVHNSVKEEDEIDAAHNRGGIQTFCDLIYYTRKGSLGEYLDIDSCEALYDDEYEGSEEYTWDDDEAVLQYPTLPMVEHFA